MSFMAFSPMGNLPRILGKRCGISHTNGFFSLRRCRCRQSGWMEAPMLTRAMLFLTVLAVTPSVGLAQSTSPNGVRTLDPPGAIKAEGTWSLGVRAGDFVFVAGMQGMDPATNALVKDPQARILRAFLNLKLIAESEGASLQDCVRLTVYVSDLHRYAPMVDKAQAELWGKPPYPPRTMIEVQRLFDDDIVEIDSVFYAPAKK
jgi:enamine deaminase RidA (YjgF/YER057c/UK114 family)